VTENLKNFAKFLGTKQGQLSVSSSCSFRPCNALNPLVWCLALFPASYWPAQRATSQPRLSSRFSSYFFPANSIFFFKINQSTVISAIRTRLMEAGRLVRNETSSALLPCPRPPEKGTAAPCGGLPAKMARPHRTGVIDSIGCASDELEHRASAGSSASATSPSVLLPLCYCSAPPPCVLVFGPNNGGRSPGGAVCVRARPCVRACVRPSASKRWLDHTTTARNGSGWSS
jgi:hypothetical protein